MAKPVHVDLEGFEGSWIEFHDPKYLPQDAFDEVLVKFRGFGNQETEEAKQGGEDFLRERISAWHISYEYKGETVSLNDAIAELTGVFGA